MKTRNYNSKRKLFAFTFDTGEVYYEIAANAEAALIKHCKYYAVSRQWMEEHCVITLAQPEN